MNFTSFFAEKEILSLSNDRSTEHQSIWAFILAGIWFFEEIFPFFVILLGVNVKASVKSNVSSLVESLETFSNLSGK